MKESRPHASRRCDDMNRGEEPEDYDEGLLTEASGLEKEKEQQREGSRPSAFWNPTLRQTTEHTPFEAKETLYLHQMIGDQGEEGTEWEE